MNYYIKDDGSVISTIGTVSDGTEITEEEFNTAMDRFSAAIEERYESQEQPVNPIAPEYNSTTVYHKGEYCTDGTSLYRCRVNYCRGIDTSNTNYWECISIADALATISSEMEN